jgi:hypothetical protein
MRRGFGTIVGRQRFEVVIFKGTSIMCDYSLQDVSSRSAKVADRLVTRDFGRGTRGFAAPEAPSVAVCVLPGTEIAFPEGLSITHRNFWGRKRSEVRYHTAIFRQINKEKENTHHDALEFPDGHTLLLTHVAVGQNATVLQLPAQPKNAAEAEAQLRVTYAG